MIKGEPETRNLGQLIRRAADRFGARTALLYKPGFRYQRWSYSQLWEQAGQVASLLQEKGLKKGDRLIIWGHNCPQWALALLGCARAGVIAVPIDLRSPMEFVQRVVSKTRPELAFVSRMMPQEREGLGLPEVRLEELDELCQGLPPCMDADVAPDDLAEIMFTSGTTGDPKGVMLTHGNLIANMEATNEYVPGNPSDRLLSLLPLSHMLEQMGGLFVTLRCGASVTYPTSRQPSVLFRTMRERSVTMMVLVPQALELFMNSIEREIRRRGKERLWGLMLKVARYTPFGLRRFLPGLRQVHGQFGGALGVVFAGGAALDPELGAKWERLGVKIIQGYGTTEASPVISCHKLASPRYDSVGLPVPGVDVRVAEDGEILIRGPNVTKGYWEAPEQTDSTFVDGWYKTGDLGYFDEQGFLHLRGRKKDMIVLSSGQNVYPEDIEATLKKHADVADVAVVGLPKGSDTEVHAALIMNESGVASEVVSWANSQLAEHQRVRGYTVWPGEDFPRTHTLKIKKAVVVEMLAGAERDAPVPVASTGKNPVSDTRDLQTIIAEVGGMSVAEVAPDGTLGTDLNLDSLKRVELLSVIEEELGAYLDESLVGPDTTVRQLQEMVAAGSATGQQVKFPSWGRSWWCRALRGAIQRILMFPLARLTYRLKVSGLEHLEGLQGPVMFAANHNLFFDNGLLIKAMPLRWRRRMAIAADSRAWDYRVWAVVNPLLGNGFPFVKEGPIRPSLDNLGRILDQGWSVLVYPEGTLTIGGPMQPFKSGVGLISVEGKVPIVPIRLHIHDMGTPWQLPLKRRGDIEVVFGKPFTFAPGTPYQEATSVLEESVRSL